MASKGPPPEYSPGETALPHPKAHSSLHEKIAPRRVQGQSHADKVRKRQRGPFLHLFAPTEKAIYAGMTLQSFLAVGNNKEDHFAVDYALKSLHKINDQLDDYQKIAAWGIAIHYYSGICAAVYKNLDETFETINIADEYIYPIDKKKSKETQESIYRKIGYRLTYSKNLKDYTISKKTIKQLREYAKGLDNNMVPECIKNLPKNFDNGERRLKPLLLKGIARYEKIIKQNQSKVD